MFVRYTLLLIVCFALLGCDQVKDLASVAISEVTKSHAQKSAEAGCWQAAVDVEAQRTKNFRALSNGPIQTTKIDDGHFLVKVTYKKITLDDPGQESKNVCMYADTTCEIKNNSITSVRPSTSFCDGFMGHNETTQSPPTNNLSMSENDRLENQRLDVTIKELETRYPELNEDSTKYNQRIVDVVLARQKVLIGQGMTLSNALRQAAADFYR